MLAVFKRISTGVKNPSARIPDKNPFSATPAITIPFEESEETQITESTTETITFINAISTEIITISMRRSIFFTITDEAKQVASVYKNGTTLQSDAL